MGWSRKKQKGGARGLVAAWTGTTIPSCSVPRTLAPKKQEGAGADGQGGLRAARLPFVKASSEGNRVSAGEHHTAVLSGFFVRFTVSSCREVGAVPEALGELCLRVRPVRARRWPGLCGSFSGTNALRRHSQICELPAAYHCAASPEREATKQGI